MHARSERPPSAPDDTQAQFDTQRSGEERQVESSSAGELGEAWLACGRHTSDVRSATSEKCIASAAQRQADTITQRRCQVGAMGTRPVKQCQISSSVLLSSFASAFLPSVSRCVVLW